MSDLKQTHFYSMSTDALARYAFHSVALKVDWYRAMAWEFLTGEVER